MSDPFEQDRKDLRRLLDQIKNDEVEDEDRFTPDERRKLREFLRAISKDEDRKLLIELVPMLPDVRAIVEGKRVSAGVYRAIGEFAKWAGGIIALIVAYKSLIAGGK